MILYCLSLFLLVSLCVFDAGESEKVSGRGTCYENGVHTMSTGKARPSRLLAGLFRAPASLYRARLGWMLGKRFLALTHRGRKSGHTYRTVLEVVSHNGTTYESIVVSAYGTTADWYRNITSEPALRVQTGLLDYVPEQRFLEPEERTETARQFCREHPWEAKLMPRVLASIGAAVPTEPRVSPQEMLSALPMVAFKPPG
jgi:deazaflavin-dependent oxidoreductase (nitroreductase family)